MLIFLAIILCQMQGSVIWGAPGVGGVYTAVPTDDIDMDGVPDVLAAIYGDYYPFPPIRLFLASGATGATIWSRSDCQGTWGNKTLLAIDDISGDSIKDCILGTTGVGFPGSTVFAISGVTSANLWTWSTQTNGPNQGRIYKVAQAPDRNGDGYPEVLAAAGGNYSNQSGTAFCFCGHTGDTLWTFRIPFDGCQSIASLGDVNNDGVPDVAAGAGGNNADNRVFGLNGATGQMLWQYNAGTSVWDVIGFVDVNNNGIEDVIAGSLGGKVICLEGSNGSVIWQRELGSWVMELVAIRDVNGDGMKDIVVGSWASVVYVLSGANGETIWSQTVGADTWPVDTLADVTGDGLPEVVAGGVNGRNVKVMNGVTGEVLWEYTYLDRVYDVTGAPDLDGDGFADVLVSLQDQQSQPYQLYA
ncbi:FG-GAP repeat protein, partial [candidate division WOR-3 bacterium]|nr:FG-GAP repeat protein [candidate division WOR-3 bacterium]